MVHDLTEKWSQLKFDGRPPFILPEDESTLKGGNVEMVWPNCHELQSSNAILDSGTRLHCGLIPCPYAGKIYSASVYVLMLNPGFSNLDVFAEETSVEFRQALIKNLSGLEPNPFFNPRFMWTGGFNYWTRKFRTHAARLALDYRKSIPDTLELLADKVAFLEMIPYHSESFGLHNTLINNLESVKLMRSFFKEVIVPRSENNECLVVITRQSRFWDAPTNENIVVYASSHARGGHLSENTVGGQRIYPWLKEAAKIAWRSQ